jgi:hypothetical protein
MDDRLIIKISLCILLTLFAASTVFHILVLSGLIPFDIVWGGRIASKNQLYKFESVSLLTNLLMLVIVSIRIGFLKMNLSIRLLNLAFFLMAALFILNTAGNLTSLNPLEKVVFTPLTALSALLCLAVAAVKKKG